MSRYQMFEKRQNCKWIQRTAYFWVSFFVTKKNGEESCCFCCYFESFLQLNPHLWLILPPVCQGKKSCISRQSRPETPAKKPRLGERTTSETEALSPLPVFFRTQAVMQELQQSASAALAQQETEQLVVEQNAVGHHLEVQAEEIIEIEVRG